jgi:hypothetical protein
MVGGVGNPALIEKWHSWCGNIQSEQSLEFHAAALHVSGYRGLYQSLHDNTVL